MKTAELTGALLDYWVGKDEDWPCNQWSTGKLMTQAEWIESHKHGSKPKPSSDWSSGGPIIERERIAIATADTVSVTPHWIATMGQVWTNDGPTPLIAAMRAYVALKYGKEVPDEKGNQ